ncbi:hypothetical protein PMI04_019350 [Sphingobium sp. AP49]|uniref:hypothetical protein n=1 Tax=Sphingobium sp. AP49 TaxID=1144307 RepID=UPI00026ED563|nr:hypothetical protein [Sphingobium sp. AP49]WHO38667.1 hypothetical protein PMI04_019350 [Sphingobium sp. AP49]
MQLESYRVAAVAHQPMQLVSALRALHLAHPGVVTRTALLFLILFVETLLFTGINGMVDDLLVSFVATVAASLLFLPMMVGGRTS